MWKDIYRIGTIGKSCWIIKNQWHESANSGTYLVELGRTNRYGKKEFVLTIVGFQLACLLLK